MFSSRGSIFNASLYVNAIRSKKFPFLNEKVPMCNELITAEQIMTMPPVSFYYIEKIDVIFKALSDNKFDGFPIRNSNGQCIGLMSRHHLMVILDNIEIII